MRSPFCTPLLLLALCWAAQAAPSLAPAAEGAAKLEQDKAEGPAAEEAESPKSPEAAKANRSAILVDIEEGTGEQVFPPNEVELRDNKFLRLEDFFNKSRVLPQTHLQRLILDLSLISPDTEDADHFYAVCMRNLRKAAPGLRQLAFDGGFQFMPERPDAGTVRAELEDVKAGTQLVVQAVRNEGIELTSIVLTVNFFIPTHYVRTSHYDQLFLQIFNKTVTDYDMERNVIGVLFTVDGVPVDAEFTFYKDNVFSRARRGRNPLIVNRLSREKTINPNMEVHPRYFYTLEKFFNENMTKVYKQDEHVKSLYYMIVTLLHDPSLKPEYFYRMAVQHLKEAAPAVRTLELWGGAAVHLPKGGRAELEQELKNFKANLEAMLRSFRALGIFIKKLDYEIFWNFNIDFIVTAAYPELVKELFGHALSAKEEEMEAVELDIIVLDVPCKLKLNFFYQPAIHSMRQERMGYLRLPPWF